MALLPIGKLPMVPVECRARLTAPRACATLFVAPRITMAED